jgi:hypothetical protein
VPHQPINLNATKPALALVARNHPNEQESVVHYGGRAQHNDPLKPDCHFTQRHRTKSERFESSQRVKNSSLSCAHFLESFPEAGSKDIRSLANHPGYLPLTHIITGRQIVSGAREHARKFWEKQSVSWKLCESSGCRCINFSEHQEQIPLAISRLHRKIALL